MGYREVTMLEIKEVLRRWCAGAAKKRIAAQLGLDIKTVRRYLRAAQACGAWPAGDAPLDDERVAAVQPSDGQSTGPPASSWLVPSFMWTTFEWRINPAAPRLPPVRGHPKTPARGAAPAETNRWGDWPSIWGSMVAFASPEHRGSSRAAA